MLILDSLDELQEWRRALAEPLGFVPTMGALHEGHLSLVRRARAGEPRTAVSIFVNPAQFGPNEDFEVYPRTRDRDLELLRGEGVDAVWFGRTDELYPPGFATEVALPSLTETLCGPSRPGHFAGVAVIVLKLLHLFRPRSAYFGRKDFQQCAVIERMVRDLDLEVSIVTGPTLREPSGLAMSSRNERLSDRGRRAATVLYRALRGAGARFAQGEVDASRLVAHAAEEILAEPKVSLEYLELVDPRTLRPVERAGADSVMAVAARVDGVRLIDNVVLGSELVLGE